MIRVTAWLFFKLLSFIYFPITVSGRENIPRKGSFILASNHRSNLDPFILGISFGRFLSFMAKEELFKNPVLAFIMKGMMAFPLKRDSADIRALKETLKRLKNGSPVVIFPQGTRKLEPDNREVEAGIGLIAVKSLVSVVPVLIEGSEIVLPPGGRRLNRHSVRIHVGEPMKFSKEMPYPAIATRILDEIFALGK